MFQRSIRVYRIPADVLSGSPPHRMIDRVLVYSNHAIVGHLGINPERPERYIVYDGWPFITQALQKTREEIETWSMEYVETDRIPCMQCRSMVRNGRGHVETCSEYAAALAEAEAREAKEAEEAARAAEEARAAEAATEQVEVVSAPTLEPDVAEADRAENAWDEPTVDDAPIVEMDEAVEPSEPADEPEPEPVDELGDETESNA